MKSRKLKAMHDRLRDQYREACKNDFSMANDLLDQAERTITYKDKIINMQITENYELVKVLKEYIEILKNELANEGCYLHYHVEEILQKTIKLLEKTEGVE